MHLLSSQIFSEGYKLFRVVGHLCWFAWLSDGSHATYDLLGRIVGLAVNNGIVLPIRFPLVLYKKLTNTLKLTLASLAEIETDVANQLAAMSESQDLTNSQNLDDIDGAGLTFSRVIQAANGDWVEFEFMPNGRTLAVTKENWDQYVAEYIKFSLVTSVEDAFQAFAGGFWSVCSDISYRRLTYDELDVLVSGLEVVDWEELKWGVTYDVGYTSKSQTIIHFWKLFDGYSHHDKRRMLKFITGSDKVPVGGLSKLGVRFERTTDLNMIPVAHTCIFTLCLPDYCDEQVLARKLQICLENCEGFGLI
jgi:ubiquitin-protein ligase E3 A